MNSFQVKIGDEWKDHTADEDMILKQHLKDGHETVKITLRGQRLQYDLERQSCGTGSRKGIVRPIRLPNDPAQQQDTTSHRDGNAPPPPTPRQLETDTPPLRRSASSTPRQPAEGKPPRLARASMAAPGFREFRPVGRDMPRRSSAAGVAAISKISSLELQLAQKEEEMASAFAEWEHRAQALLETNALLKEQLAAMRSSPDVACGEEHSSKWRDIALAREAELVNSRALVKNLRAQLARLDSPDWTTASTPRQVECPLNAALLTMGCSGDGSDQLDSQHDAEELTKVVDRNDDCHVLEQTLHSACLRLGSQWSNWIYRSAGRRVVIPTWNGCYLSFPKAEHVDEEEEEADYAPVPPASSSWDWPLSRQEKKERVVYVNRQMLMADQRSLMEHIEDLQEESIRRGVKSSTPFPWDSS